MEENFALAVETFNKGEKVLCYHRTQIYTAKLLEYGNTAENAEKYLVHYIGWKHRWDEWVPRNRVLKYNEENRLLQRELAKEALVPKRSVTKKHRKTNKRKISSAKATSTSSSNIGNPASATLASDQLEETMHTATSAAVVAVSNKRLPEPDSKIQIPEELKKILLEDWYHVAKLKELCQLPAILPVQAIVNKYVKYKQRDKSAGALSNSAVQAVAAGIMEYFNKMLDSQLLYEFERKQYLEIIRLYACVPMTQIYGISHLLRLFVKLDPILAFSSLDNDSLSAQISYMNDFLSFILQHKASLKKSQPYIESTADYIRKKQ